MSINRPSNSAHQTQAESSLPWQHRNDVAVKIRSVQDGDSGAGPDGQSRTNTLRLEKHLDENCIQNGTNHNGQEGHVRCLKA